GKQVLGFERPLPWLLRGPRLTINDNLLRLGGVRNNLEAVADLREAFQADYFDGHRRLRFLGWIATIVKHRPNLAEECTADEKVADTKCSVANQHGGDRSAAFIKLRFKHGAKSRPVRIRFEIQDVGHQQYHFEQQVQILAR